MTAMDGFFVGMAILDLVFIAGMVVAAMKLLQTTRKGAEKAAPALRELKALQETGTAMANHLSTDGRSSMLRIKTVAEAVKRRVANTQRILRELRPHAEETSLRVRETSADLSQKAHAVGDMAQRLSRLRTAAVAARQAARDR